MSESLSVKDNDEVAGVMHQRISHVLSDAVKLFIATGSNVVASFQLSITCS